MWPVIFTKLMHIQFLCLWPAFEHFIKCSENMAASHCSSQGYSWPVITLWNALRTLLPATVFSGSQILISCSREAVAQISVTIQYQKFPKLPQTICCCKRHTHLCGEASHSVIESPPGDAVIAVWTWTQGITNVVSSCRFYQNDIISDLAL